MKSKRIAFLAESAVIAALYAVVTYVSAMFNLAYGAVQFRISEALTILPVFTPAAIPGLTLGCFIANLGSPLGIVDWIFGTTATLLGAVLTWMLRNITFKGLPLISVLMPVLANTVIVGFELCCLTSNGTFSFAAASLPGFIAAALSVGIGELVICFGLGIPLIVSLRKTNIFTSIRR